MKFFPRFNEDDDFEKEVWLSALFLCEQTLKEYNKISDLKQSSEYADQVLNQYRLRSTENNETKW